jgi:hypothetical protein
MSAPLNVTLPECVLTSAEAVDNVVVLPGAVVAEQRDDLALSDRQA